MENKLHAWITHNSPGKVHISLNDDGPLCGVKTASLEGYVLMNEKEKTFSWDDQSETPGISFDRLCQRCLKIWRKGKYFKKQPSPKNADATGTGRGSRPKRVRM